VKEGRGIYENIKRAVHFLLSCNIGELFTVFCSIILSLPSPLSAIQLLWINLTTDSLPAIALGLEKTPDDVMERAPIKADSPLFSPTRVFRMIFEGILIGTLAAIAFAVGANSGGFAVGRTMSFLTLGVSQLFHSFNLRSEKSVFSRKVKRNPFVIFSFVFCLALQTLVVLIPKAANLFGVASLSGKQWLITFLLSSCPLLLTEIYKSLKK
jgi:Ca2+-transporting ATPase